jgi:chromosome segregation ATPase
MKTRYEILNQQLDDDAEDLRGLKSYITELNTMTAKYGTDKAQYEEDLQQAEHNVKYYEAEMGQLKKELGSLPKAERPGLGTSRPHTQKPPLSPFIISSISFAAGALLGSRLKCRRRGKDE